MTKTAKTARTKRATRAQLVEMLASAAPERWTVSTGDGYRDSDMDLWPSEASDPTSWVIFDTKMADDAGTAIVVLNVSKASRPYDYHTVEGHLVEGHVLVNGRSFTRRGHDTCSVSMTDDSSKVEPDYHSFGAVAPMLAAQLARCERAEARRKTAIPLPGTNFTRQPEWFVTARQQLDAGRAVDLTPHGMGTGVRIERMIGATARHGRPAHPELCKLLGGPPLVLTDLDCD